MKKTPELVINSNPKSIFFNTQLPLRLPPVSQQCEIPQPHLGMLTHPLRPNIEDFTLKRSLPLLSPEALLPILRDNNQNDQPTEEWTHQTKEWIKMANQLDQILESSNTGNHLNIITEATTIPATETTTSDPKTIK